MKIPFEKIFEADLIHPLEEKSRRECQNNPLYDWLANQGAELKNRINERADASLNLYPVTKFTAPRLNRLYKTALARLDCRERYPLYLKFNYAIKFEVSGSDSDSYIIVISDTVDDLSDEELLALFGQALGRIKIGHVKNLQLLKILEGCANSLPMGEALGKTLWSAFATWNIAAQFSIDRAALFASGSERAVASLLMKQCGELNLDLQEILSRPLERPRDLGIYFVWLMQSLPNFGGVERIQELRRWIRSDAFKKDYPGFYFRTLLDDEDADEENFPQLELHRAAANGIPPALVMLGEKYLRGDGVPKSRFMMENLFKAAAFHGDAKAMYIYSVIMEDFPNADAKIIRRLREAAARRGFDAALKKIGALSPVEENPLVEKICAEFAATYQNQTACKTMLDDEQQEKIRAMFWMNPDEKIFAAETFFDGDEMLGTAITAAGVSGRISLGRLPFRYSWRELKKIGVYRRQLRDDKNYLIADTEPIYRVGNILSGTMAELLIKLLKD